MVDALLLRYSAAYRAQWLPEFETGMQGRKGPVKAGRKEIAIEFFCNT